MEQVGKCKLSKNTKIQHKRKKDVLLFIDEVREPIAHIGDGDFLNINRSRIIYAKDFNFDTLYYGIKYNTVFCFEILEHLQNPLFFLMQIKSIMSEDGVLYLSTPNKPKFLWSEFHYNEISAKHMQKWLLDPLNMKIVRKKRLRMNLWTDYLIGFRPFLRALKNPMPLIKTLTNITWIYEIRLKN